MPYKNEFGELPDNFGINWASGVYGGDNLPLDWSFMEFRVPVLDSMREGVTWVRARAERRQEEDGVVVKSVTVENNPFGKLFLQPWLEDKTVEVSEESFAESESCQQGHKCWSLDRASNASVVVHLIGKI